MVQTEKRFGESSHADGEDFKLNDKRERLRSFPDEPPPFVVVVVVGDFGRSPRMQYHALSLAKAGCHVSVIGCQGSRAIRPVYEHQNIDLHLIREARFETWPRVARYLLRTVYLAMALMWTLVFVVGSGSIIFRSGRPRQFKRPSTVLVQNPPALPTLPCAWLACKLLGARLVVDWHNYGYTILALTNQRDGALVRFYEWIEFYFGRRADRAFCVSAEMQRDLALVRGIDNVAILYDRPPARFEILDFTSSVVVQKVHQLLLRLSADCSVDSQHDSIKSTVRSDDIFEVSSNRMSSTSRMKIFGCDSSTNETLLTRVDNTSGKPVLKTRAKRPFLLVSSTSWTEDEDFSLLLSALIKYDKIATEAAANMSEALTGNSTGFVTVPPCIVCVVTGRGPQKEFYMKKISGFNLTKVHIVTPWLPADDYAFIVALCDLGVCLHKSSSSLDLPMKVVDMFGCGVPVLALSYRCITELVRPGETGLLFATSDELCQHLLTLTDAKNESLLQSWRQNICNWQKLRWEENWKKVARETFF